ncbi:hypothetical protein ABEB36_013571 [Hypothenemus hampei]|uniref:Checkpoint protein n=1 Tax=Hypothenemus hampei TaxID=57062 RepID=A0ABD1E4N4_HYPHA
MKFRALMVESVAMRDFLNISLSLAKFSKTCVLRLTKKKLYFIVSQEDGGPRTPLVWCELPSSFYFKEYNVSELSETHGEIYLEFSTILLSRSCSVLKQEVKSVKMKLTNKENPCLTLEMELLALQCVHDIPVEIISRKHWSDYEEPVFSDFHVSIQMPYLKSLKNIVEQMKHLSQILTVRANKSGELTLEIQTTTVNLKAHFPDLSVKSFAVNALLLSSNKDEATGADTVSAAVDIKKFLMFLSGMQLNNCTAVCNIVQGKIVKLSMEQPGALLMQIFLSQLSI